MPTSEDSEAMPIAEVKLNFSDLMETIVTTYGDKEEESTEEGRRGHTRMSLSKIALAVIVALAYFSVASLVTPLQITVTDTDCQIETIESDPLASFTDQELQEANVTGSLTVDQCIQLHEQGVKWEIDVLGRVR